MSVHAAVAREAPAELGRKHARLLAHLRAASEHANLAIMITEAAPLDPPGPRVIHVNPAFTRLTGFAADDILGRTSEVMQGSATDAKTVARVRRALAAGRGATAKLVSYRQDNSPFLAALEVFPVNSRCGRPVCFVALGREVPLKGEEADGDAKAVLVEETRRMARALAERNALLRNEVETRRAAEQRAKQADAAKSQFLATATHDLRQPLNALSILLGVARATDDPRKLREATERMQTSLSAMIELFDALLDLSAFEANAKPSNTGVELNDVLQRLRSDFEPAAQAKGLVFKAMPARGWVQGEPVLVERILRNLVANAIQHTQRGRVLVGVRSRGRQARVEVHDDGPGMHPEELKRIFKHFYRGPNSGGHGLGLSIAKRAAELIGASIEVTSKSCGSCFALVLPQASNPRPGGEASRIQARRPRRFGLRVLCAEDDQASLEALRLLLEAVGCEARCAVDLRRALDALDDGWCPQAVLSDFGLPDGDGFDVIEGVRKRCGRTLPAWLVSGDFPRTTARAAAERGIRLLRKPLDRERLEAALDQVGDPSNDAPATGGGGAA